MDRPIQKGDLVVVVHTHCSKTARWLGHTFIVVGLGFDYQNKCNGCGENLGPLHHATREDKGYYSLNMLKRIPPLEELEGEKSQTTISEMGRELLGLKAKA